MAEKLTEELLQELLSKDNISDYIDDYTDEDMSFCDYLNKLKSDTGLSRLEITKATNINETHAYQIFKGSRGASRNKILQLSLAMNLDIRSANRLLHSAGVSTLYCKSRRDAIIIFCLKNNYSVTQTDDELFNFNESTLSDE